MERLRRLEILKKQEQLCKDQITNLEEMLKLSTELESNPSKDFLRERIELLESENKKMREESMNLLDEY